MRLQYDNSFTALLGEIEFIEDKYIKSVEASYTQINNSQIVVVFTVWLKKIMFDKDWISFIKSNKDVLKDKEFIGACSLDQVVESGDYQGIQRLLDELAQAAVQAKISEILWFNYGTKYILPTCTYVHYPEELYNKEKLRNCFLKMSYEISNGEQYLIVDETSSEGLDMTVCFTNNHLTHLFSFTNLLSNFRMDFYYYLFNRIEKWEMDNRINGYFNESKKRIKNKDYKWIVNKLRLLNDNILHSDLHKRHLELINDWKGFYDGKEEEIGFLSYSYSENYRKIYLQCIEHFKVIYSLQRENLIIGIASFTLIATLIGILITLI